MSFCINQNRNQPHLQSLRYLTDTAHKLRSTLQCWIANLLGSGWMFYDYIHEAAAENGLLYPLGALVVDHKGNGLISGFIISRFYLS